jgi:hypothetical protein
LEVTEGQRKYRDPRAEKLRASGMVGSPAPRVKATGEAMRRARVSRQQGALGAPLEERVRKQVRSQPGTNVRVFHPAFGGLAIAFCMAFAGFMVDGFIAMVVLGVGGFVLGVLILRLMNINRGVQNAGEALATAAEFDAFVSSRAPRLPEGAMTSLNEMKSLFVRLFPALRSTQAAGVFGVDDVFFVHQAVKRYLPDAIDPYLALQAPTEAPLAAMQEQLDLVTRKLRVLSDRLDDVHVQELLRNRNFLVRKLDS